MDTFKCLDCGEGIEKSADDTGDLVCPACGGLNLVEVFGILAHTDGPI